MRIDTPIVDKIEIGAIDTSITRASAGRIAVEGSTVAFTSDITGTNSGTNTGDQTLTNTSDATSHTATLSASGGSLKLVEGTGITLATTGTGADGVVTITSTATISDTAYSAGWNGDTTSGPSKNAVYDEIENIRTIPQNSQSAAYTTVLADAGKHIYHPSADTTARTWTIDSNANVAYPIGTAITFVNDTSAGTVTISVTSDTMVLLPAGTTGNRTLAANGIATAMKVASTRWVISGQGLT